MERNWFKGSIFPSRIAIQSYRYLFCVYYTYGQCKFSVHSHRYHNVKPPLRKTSIEYCFFSSKGKPYQVRAINNNSNNMRGQSSDTCMLLYTDTHTHTHCCIMQLYAIERAAHIIHGQTHYQSTMSTVKFRLYISISCTCDCPSRSSTARFLRNNFLNKTQQR